MAGLAVAVAAAGNPGSASGSGALGGVLLLALAAVLPPTPDDVLVARCQAGDRGAFGELVLRHQHRVFAICRRMMGDEAVAEEVAQDVFVSAWRALGGFRAEARFDTWLRRIAVNKCKNRRLYQSRRAAERHESVDAAALDRDRPALQLVHGGRGPEAGVERRQATAVLDAALEALDDEQRAIILLRDLEDMSYDEIADLLEVPRGTVKSRLHRARAALARVLQAQVGRADVF